MSHNLRLDRVDIVFLVKIMMVTNRLLTVEMFGVQVLPVI